MLAIFACLQITRRIITVLDGTVKTETVFPDLYEASVLELHCFRKVLIPVIFQV